MLKIDKEKKIIHINRGDAGTIKLSVTAIDGPYTPNLGDIIRFSVYQKGDYGKVILRKNYEIQNVDDPIKLTLFSEDTKIGGIINAPVTYWYEIELNPDTDNRTLIGHDEKGPKLFILYPEGGDA